MLGGLGESVLKAHENPRLKGTLGVEGINFSKEREVITDFGTEAKSVRSENNLWLLKGRVWLSELKDHWVVSLDDSGAVLHVLG